MTNTMQTSSAKGMIATALACQCPRCQTGDLYKKGTYLDVNEVCAICGLPLAKNDSADGPAVFLIFALGVLLVPAALLFEYLVHPPLWVHAILWTIVALALTLGTLRPLKALVIGLQYKHRPGDWGESKPASLSAEEQSL